MFVPRNSFLHATLVDHVQSLTVNRDLVLHQGDCSTEASGKVGEPATLIQRVATVARARRGIQDFFFSLTPLREVKRKQSLGFD